MPTSLNHSPQCKIHIQTAFGSALTLCERRWFISDCRSNVVISRSRESNSISSGQSRINSVTTRATTAGSISPFFPCFGHSTGHLWGVLRHQASTDDNWCLFSCADCCSLLRAMETGGNGGSRGGEGRPRKLRSTRKVDGRLLCRLFRSAAIPIS